MTTNTETEYQYRTRKAQEWYDKAQAYTDPTLRQEALLISLYHEQLAREAGLDTGQATD